MSGAHPQLERRPHTYVKFAVRTDGDPFIRVSRSQCDAARGGPPTTESGQPTKTSDTRPSPHLLIMGNATAEHDTNTGRAGYEGTGHVSVGGPQVNGVCRSSWDKIITFRDQINTNIFWIFPLAKPPRALNGAPEPSAAGGKDEKGHISPSPDSSNWWTVAKILLVIVLVCLATVTVWSAWKAFRVVKAVVKAVWSTNPELAQSQSDHRRPERLKVICGRLYST
ncbi:hypothetical protein EDB80DRAFT_771691 [Ilyonectria destructans]|nr:hypothetical protein EDB80DRAFT_771691 [Ilyonectria destructans]